MYCDVEPKRRALAQANAELAAAQEKLSIIKRKVQSLEDQLSKLTADFEQATADKLRCQKEADATQATIQLANRLVGGLASENVRWAQAVAEYVIYYCYDIYHLKCACALEISSNQLVNSSYIDTFQ